MAAATLEHKLEAQDEPNPEQTWNLSRWPTRLTGDETNRLFVAVNGKWRGYFILQDEVLFNPSDSARYTLIFDTRTWTCIPPTPVRRFRGFTYKVPTVSSTPSSSPPS
jgi:hypothetical protein